MTVWAAPDDPVRFEGLRTVEVAQARTWVSSQLDMLKKSGVSAARADDLAYFLETAMRQQGYSEATVDWKLEGAGEGARIVLLVAEGETFTIGRILVEGNAALEDEAVVELLTSPTRKRLRTKEGEILPYVKEDIRRGLAQVTAFYRLMGFRGAKVNLDTQLEGRRVDLRVQVEEGRESRVGHIEFPAAPTPALEAEFAKLREEFVGKLYSESVSGNLASRIRSSAVAQGYYHARVEVVEQGDVLVEGHTRVDLLVSADWGGPVAISALRVKGNEKVRTDFFERHFSKLIGRPYSPSEAYEVVNDLLQTGVLETVRTEVSPQADGSYLLDVAVEEGPSRTLGVYGGFTNYEGPIGGFEFRHLNLFGSVRKLDAAVEFSQRGARGEVKYTDPWFLDGPYQFGGGLFAVNRDEEGYEKFKTGGRYEWTRRFGRRKQDSFAIFGEAAYTDVHEAEIDPRFLGERQYFTHQLGLTLTHDRRDNPRRPRKGFLAQASLAAASAALGSEVEYWKAGGRLGYYLPFGDHTLRLGARAGLITPLGDTDEIPIDLRYFNGGPFSVRSFQERAMGLRDPSSGYAVGGNFYSVFSAEYEIPLPGVDGLSLAPFADAGNLIFDESQIRLDELRYAIGLGLRYETPIGPIRLEYGFNPDQRPGEPEGTFHLGFGLGY